MIKAVIFDVFETLVTHYNCPLYFGEQIAEDIGICNEKFQEIWEPAGERRTIGKISLEEVLEEILRNNNCYSEKLLRNITEKRVATKKLCFNNIDSAIIPMLKERKQSKLKLAIISNCFSEEVPLIRNNSFTEYFDEMFLSYEQGIQKPNPEIYLRCIRKLEVEPEECLYIGDGGSNELVAAKQIGMNALQAGWYIIKSGQLESRRQEQFPLLKQPRDIFSYI